MNFFSCRLECPNNGPEISVYLGFYPKNLGAHRSDPQKALPCAERRVLSPHWSRSGCNETIVVFFATKRYDNFQTETPRTTASSSSAGNVSKNCASQPIPGFTECCQSCDCQMLYTHLRRTVANYQARSQECQRRKTEIYSHLFGESTQPRPKRFA